jgi:hypothetical protein
MSAVSSLKSITFPVSLNATRAHIGLALLYVVLIFALPANYHLFSDYHLTAFAYRVLLLIVTLPLFAAWLAAFCGYVSLRAYAQSIAKSPENNDFERLANGCGWLAWSLPIPGLLGLIFDSIAGAHPSFNSAASILISYVNLVMLLVAFSIIGASARGLIGRTKVRLGLAGSRLGMLLLVVGSVLYCYLGFRRLGSTDFGATDNPYFLPVWLWLSTVVVPYLYAWYVGLLAIYEINVFSAHVRGLLYRRPLRMLVAGLIVVITSFVALQYINAVAPRSGHLVLNYKLLLVSCCRIICAAGFAVIALGAGRLRKIEEV